MDVQNHLSLPLLLSVLLLPMAGGLLSLLRFTKVQSSVVSSGFVFVALLFCTFLLINGNNINVSTPWLHFFDGRVLTVGLQATPFSLLIAVMVLLVSFLVHVYSAAYMRHDPGIRRYFGLLGFFTTAMLGILFSPSLLQLFFFWELVGFSSYLLIGFWYKKPAAAAAAKKAFVINRIGDIGVLVAIGTIWSLFQTTDFEILYKIFAEATWENGALVSQGVLVSQVWLWVIGFGLLCGVAGKSAQFPLLVWLPDAMEGPTPVSALIHAATMVAAGVFLLAKTFVFLSSEVLLVAAIIGALTALWGAIIALTQTDIKKVLAYSTISQLGYMVMGMGVGAWYVALLHLITHAFFKACLFLSAGSVISAIHESAHESGKPTTYDAQDMRQMGGLMKYMPITFISYLLAMLSLIGVPFFSGFLSKDAIILSAWQWANLQSKTTFSPAYLIPLMATVAILLTSVYMTKQLIWVFLGNERSDFSVKPKEVTGLQKWPTLFLGALSLVFFFSLNPFLAEKSWIYGIIMTGDYQGMIADNVMKSTTALHVFVGISSVLLVAIGAFISWRKYWGISVVSSTMNSQNEHHIPRLMDLDKFYHFIFQVPYMKLSRGLGWIDANVADGIVHFVGIFTVVFSVIIGWFDRVIVDGVVNFAANLSQAIGRFTKSFHSGNLQSYFLWTFVFLLLVIIWMIN